MLNKKILYVSNSCFPNSASGIRVTNLSKLLKNIGYDVELLSNNLISFIPDDYLKQIEIKEVDGFLTFNYNGLVYYYKNNKLLNNKVFNFIELLLNNFQINNIRTICKVKKIDILILYNPLYRVAKILLKFCKKYDIKLIIDNTEWYEGKKDFFGNHIAKSVNRRITKLDKKINNIISISPWMNRWYIERNINSICVLPLMEKFHKPIVFNKSKIINLIYCGVPGKKDLIEPLVDCIKKLNENENRFKLTIIGVDYEYFNDEKLSDYNIFCLGKVRNDKVYQYYQESDFSCLFRYDKRYARAGFSTKVAESLSNGVPVLCNVVGGTDDIIVNSENGFKISSFNEKELNQMLLMLLTLSDVQIYNLKMKAYECSQKYFNSDNYASVMKKFIEE